MSSSCHGILQARIREQVAVPFSRGIFPTQGSNKGLLHGREVVYHLSRQAGPEKLVTGYKTMEIKSSAESLQSVCTFHVAV